MPPENFAKIFFGRALNRPRESRGSQPSACFCGTFCTPQKVPKNVPLQGDSRFCKPRISAQNYKFTLTKLNPFEKFRGSANLDSARRNGGFARTKLKPSQKEIRGSANLESAHPNNKFAQTQLNPLKTFTYFLLDTKSMTKKPSLAGRESRFCKPRSSSPQPWLRNKYRKESSYEYPLFLRHL